MSDKNVARRTQAVVSFSGIDITASLRPHLISITYTDNEEDTTDDLQIKITDRESVWLTKWLSDAIQAIADAKPTTSSAAKSRSTVRKWSNGQDVKDMQALLVGYGFALPVYGVDGIFGGETERAVKEFQKARGLSVDGVCGPKTWAELEKPESGAAKHPGFMIEAVYVRENWNSDGKDKVLDCGKFELDAVTADGPPATITMKGTSLPYGTQIRQMLKSKTWESVHLSSVASEIAEAGGMICMFESSSDPFYARLEQIKTSDIAYLSMLCHDAGISLKVTNGIMVLFDQAEYEKKPPVLDIKRGSIGKYSKWRLLTGETDTKYTSCRVSYVDPSSGRKIEGFAYTEDNKKDGKNNQQLEVTAKVNSISEAKTLAEKRLRMQNKHGLTARFTVPGNPELLAGVTVTLTNWGLWSGKYIIKQAQHVIGKSGYTTQIQLRPVLGGY